MKNYSIIYYFLLSVCFSVFTTTETASVLYAQKLAVSSVALGDHSAIFLDKDISIPENVFRYFTLPCEMPYVDEITSLPEQALPIIAYVDVMKATVRLFVWSDGTIVWYHKDHDRPDHDKYCLGKIDKERIESINAEIVRNGEKYFSGRDRFRDCLHLRSEFGSCRTHIMLPNFFYYGGLSSSRLSLYIEAKESLKEYTQEERVMFVKKITGYHVRPLREAFSDYEATFLLLCYKNLLLGRSVTDVNDDEVLSDDEINAIAPYLFDDIDYFLFCRDIFLSLIPPDGQGTEVEVKYVSRENRKVANPPSPFSVGSRIYTAATSFFRVSEPSDHLRDLAVTIVSVYREAGKIRYEYHRGTIGEYLALSKLLQKNQTATEGAGNKDE